MLYLPSAPGIPLLDTSAMKPGRSYRQTGVPLPAPYSDGIKFAQTFYDANEQHPPVIPSPLIGTRSIVWGSQSGTPGVYTTRYTPSIRGNPTEPNGGTPTLAWFKANHPDWLVYQNDRTTLFQAWAYDYAERPDLTGYPAGYYFVDLDFQNPEVRQYKLQYCIDQVATGFTGMAFDNVGLTNEGATPTQPKINCAGHYVGAAYDPVSGVRTAGTWVQDYEAVQYNGVPYAAAFLDYMQWMRANLNALGIPLMANIDPPTVQTESFVHTNADMIQNCDIWFAEGRPQNQASRDPVGADWIVWYQVVTEFANNGGVWFDGSYTSNLNPNLVSQNEVSWIVANFLLMKGQYSYLNAGVAHSFFTMANYWNPPIGHPLGLPAQIAPWLWQRFYSNGRVIVNPHATQSFRYTLPAGTWADQFGNALSVGANTLAAQSGVVILPA